MFVGNVRRRLREQPLLDRLRNTPPAGRPVVAICAKIEAEMAEMDDADRDMFLESWAWKSRA
jgi:ribosome-binding ATPase YchF (GTP1/OBG family)